ncbi:MAG: hypothetical protein AAFQ82_08115, partial [Myxococcota bacterium]
MTELRAPVTNAADPARTGPLPADRTTGEPAAAPAPAPAVGRPVALDRMDNQAAVLAGYNARAADPLNPSEVRLDPRDEVAAAQDSDESTRPSFFRKVLEVAEFAARFFMGWINLASAALRILRMVFDPPTTGEEWSKELTRLGIDLMGGLFPPAAALGHLTLNAWWGADNPSDTELLAGYDAYLDGL